MLKTQKLDKEYFSPKEVTLEAQKNFLDPVLLRFIGWLSSKTKLDEGDEIHDSDIDVKTLAISSDITTLSSCVITPKHLGLTVHLHHTFGSKKLIEDLSVLGHTMPYSEIRHFLTSAAVHMSHSQEITLSGGLVPLNIRPRVDGEKMIIVAGDNWDHNEHTLSGKKTTHAMTSILISQKNNGQESSTRIPRVPERSLGISTLPGKSTRV